MQSSAGHKGYILLQVLVSASIALMVVSGLASWGIKNNTATQQNYNRELALHIAEAGIEYYRWHLAHAQNDYQDGTGVPGPYVHNFNDKDGNIIGNYTLTITPPPVGSTVVAIKSTGVLVNDPKLKRSIEVRLGISSWAKFAVVANTNMRFGVGTEVFGPIHSNEGIRFDGVAHNSITSAVAQYNDPDHGNGSKEFGVHTHVEPVDPQPPSAVPTRTDVFEAGRQFPVPAIDFTGITNDLSAMKTKAQSNGKYLANSGKLGYHIVFKTNDTFDLYRVDKLESIPNGCTEVLGQKDWGTWSIKASGGESLLGNYPNPSNGIIFLEDNVWVDGTINTSRMTVAAAEFPDNSKTRKSITINKDLLYTNYDGTDALSLIARYNINAGLMSEDDLRIDAALFAQNGRVGRFYYKGESDHQDRCSPYHIRTKITLYGMLATAERYGFAYTDGTGYQTRSIIFDTNLQYSPPPSFPLTSDQYSIISWKEVK